MSEKIRVTLAMPVADELQEMIRNVDPRLEVTALTRGQRHVYRGGRPLWGGYGEPPPPADEDEEEAKRRLEEVLAGTEVLFTNPVVPEDLPARAPGLRWMQMTSAGVDRLVDSPVVRSHYAVTTASGIHAAPISEYVIGTMLAFAKGLPRAAQAKTERAWRPYWPEEVEGRTIGVVGVGAIGARVAEIAKALGMRVLAVRRSAKERSTGADAGFPAVDEMLPPSELPYLLAKSDYVALAVPLTAESRKMIGEAELRAMKPAAVLINIARGAVVDEAALVQALREGRIAGAALDVFEQEPLPPESELWDMENVILTPHISGGTPRYMERAVGLFCENLRRYAAAEELLNVVDPERGY